MSNKQVCELTIDGMHCDSCELFMEQTVKKQSGVIKVKANSSSQSVKVTLDEDVSIDEFKRKVQDQIEKQGYRIVENLPKQEVKKREVVFSLILAVILFALFLLFQKLNVSSLLETKALSYPAIFTLGFLASLSTCMAVVGGVAMTLSSKFAVEHQNKATFIFHLSRLIGFIMLGGVVGLLGRAVVINATISAILRIVIALVMVSVGAGFVGLKLPKLVLPKSISEFFGFFDDKDGWTNAVLLGVATFFLPCAFTQSMQLYAMSTGSFITGALVMGTFALGTLPVLALVSFGSATGVSKLNKGIFGFTMGYLIILFAIFNLLSALNTLGIIPAFLY